MESGERAGVNAAVNALSPIVSATDFVGTGPCACPRVSATDPVGTGRDLSLPMREHVGSVAGQPPVVVPPPVAARIEDVYARGRPISGQARGGQAQGPVPTVTSCRCGNIIPLRGVQARGLGQARGPVPTVTPCRYGRGRSTEMKIMIFPVKFHKFTGFFHKFLKLFEAETILIICRDSKICRDMLKYHFRKLRKFTELKKFFRILHLPAIARAGLTPAPATRRPRRRPRGSAPGCARRARWARSCR